MADVGGILYDKDATVVDIGENAPSQSWEGGGSNPRAALLHDIKQIDPDVWHSSEVPKSISIFNEGIPAAAAATAPGGGAARRRRVPEADPAREEDISFADTDSELDLDDELAALGGDAANGTNGAGETATEQPPPPQRKKTKKRPLATGTDSDSDGSGDEADGAMEDEDGSVRQLRLILPPPPPPLYYPYDSSFRRALLTPHAPCDMLQSSVRVYWMLIYTLCNPNGTANSTTIWPCRSLSGNVRRRRLRGRRFWG